MPNHKDDATKAQGLADMAEALRKLLAQLDEGAVFCTSSSGATKGLRWSGSFQYYVDEAHEALNRWLDIGQVQS